MKRIHLLVLLSVLALLLGAASARGSGSGSLVVGEVYAAGGNTGAVYANDYVELFNRGASPVAIDGWTLQYASAASASWQSTALSGTIPAGGRYLVQLASGGLNGAALPAADATGTSNLAVTPCSDACTDGAAPANFTAFCRSSSSLRKPKNCVVTPETSIDGARPPS
jgi:predicted extracellular nuclease